VIRNIQRPGVRMEQFNSGTESELGGAGVSGASALPPSEPLQAPVPVPAPVPAPAQPAAPAAPAQPGAAGSYPLNPTPPGTQNK
jgi:hypothetical protein